MSEVVFEGKVVKQWSEINTYGMAVTYVEVAVSEAIYGGTLSGELLVGFPGGAYPDGAITKVPGCPALSVGETVLVLAQVKDDVTVLPLDWGVGLLRAYTTDDGSVVATDGAGDLLAAIPENGPEKFVTRTQDLAGDFGEDSRGSGVLLEPEQPPSAVVNVLTAVPNSEEVAAAMTWEEARDAVLLNVLLSVQDDGAFINGYSAPVEGL
jgi:hypothetical protein